MKPRFNYAKLSAGGNSAMRDVGKYLAQSSIEAPLIHLIKFRVSQINGCAYCLDMHSKDLRALGESEQRLYSLHAWRECPYYTDRERSALAWAEALTHITNGHASDEAYAEASANLSEQEISDLTFVIATINAWNRIAIASRAVPGTYQPAKVHEAAKV